MTEQATKNIPEISISEVSARIKHLVHYLFSKWFTILLISLTGALVGITYAWSQQAKYSASLTFSMEDDKAENGGLASIASQFGLSMGGVGGVFSGESILALIKSNRIIESTLLSKITVDNKSKSLLNLYLDVYDAKKEFQKSKDTDIQHLAFPEQQDPSTFTRTQDSVLQVVMTELGTRSLKAEKPDLKYNLYNITFTSSNEFFSDQFCTQLIKQVSAFYVDIKTKRSAQIVSLLQARADSIKKAYDNALVGRAELSDANINTAFQKPVVGIQRKQTDVTVLATAYGELLKNLEIAKFNLLKETPLIQIIDEPMLPLPKKKLGRLIGGLLGAFAFGFVSVVWLSFKKWRLR